MLLQQHFSRHEIISLNYSCLVHDAEIILPSNCKTYICKNLIIFNNKSKDIQIKIKIFEFYQINTSNTNIIIYFLYEKKIISILHIIHIYNTAIIKLIR